MRPANTPTPAFVFSLALAALAAPTLAHAQDVAEEAAPVAESAESPYLAGLKIGGALRGGYAIGTYGAKTGHPSRAWKDWGNFTFDAFILNLSYEYQGFGAAVEYRFLNGSQFFRHAFLSYNFEDIGKASAGLVRAPFGATLGGASMGFFYDMSYNVGLADDMDLGVKWEGQLGDLKYDVGYFLTSEPGGRGSSRDSSRFAYDIVDETPEKTGYEEAHQVNLRAIYSVKTAAMTADLGVSGMFGLIKSNGPQDDGSRYAGAAHALIKAVGAQLILQGTYYKYDTGEGNDEIVLGCFDYPNVVAAEGMIAAASLSYEINAGLSWLDKVVPYVDYSVLFKAKSGWKNSNLISIGAQWINGGWFIYSELLLANGAPGIGQNYRPSNRMTDNLDPQWKQRFNVNIGYYF